METNKQMNMDMITEQEVGSPVPVGVAGGRAGPARPSSSVCSAPLVGNQARVQEMVTGTEGTSDPFKRRDSLMRTPPRYKSFSLSDVNTIEDIGQVEEIQPSQKRRREESPNIVDGVNDDEQQKATNAIKELAKKIGATAKDLKALVKSIPNTKGEIKKAILELDRQAEMLERRTKIWQLPLKQTETAVVEKKKTASIGIQTDSQDMINEKGKAERAKLAEIQEILAEGKVFGDLVKTLDEEWSSDVFIKTKLEAGNQDKVNYRWRLSGDNRSGR